MKSQRRKNDDKMQSQKLRDKDDNGGTEEEPDNFYTAAKYQFRKK